MLHAYVAAEAVERNLSANESMSLLRRCEVVVGGISTLHKDPHPGMSRAHGAEKIAPAMSTNGTLDVTRLAASEGYAQAKWGFLGPYFASETLLGLVAMEEGMLRPGQWLDVSAVQQGFRGLAELASSDQVDQNALLAHQHLCLCQGLSSPDGAALRQRLLPAAARPMEPAGRRSQTIRLLLRLLQLHGGATSVQHELMPYLLFAREAQQDDLLDALDITPAWIGVALRALSVAAWRDLWSWMVSEIGGAVSIADFGELLAAQLPIGSLQAYIDGLPDRTSRSGGHMVAAETDVNDRVTPDRCLAVLILGALRADELPPRVAAYFEGPSDQRERLTPTWLRGRVEEWLGRSLHDFARFISEQLVHRSQQIALSKSRFDRVSGRVHVPTRVFVRDGQIFRDSDEASGGISLRWDSLMTVLAGVGLAQWAGGSWRVCADGDLG